MFDRWHKLSKTIDSKKAGYSDMRIWPAQLLYYHLLVVVATQTSIWFALPLVTIPALLIAMAIANFEEATTDTTGVDWARLDADFMKNIRESRQADYDIQKYEIIMPARTTKERYIHSALEGVFAKRYKRDSHL